MEQKKLFDGIKVLAMVRQVAAPFASYQLALHGADVLKLENPKEPDSMRAVLGAPGNPLGKKLMSHSFMAQGSNKRSMTLNIATPEGQDIFKRLAKDADVVIENLVAGAMGRYGLSYNHLKEINPRLVYCSVTGYGQDGPNSKRAAIDGAVQAAAGLMSLTGTPESGPLKAGHLLADYATGYAAALGIVSALYYRERTGRGQYIDTAMLDTAMTMAGADICEAATTGNYRQLRGNGDGRYISAVFKCKEGALSVSATTDSRRQRFFKALDRMDIYTDPRFKDPETVMRESYPEMKAEIEKTLAAKTAIEWEEIVSDAGVAAMAVRDLYQAVANPQIVHRGLMHTFPHDDELGFSVVVPKTSYQMSETKAHIHSPPPRFGQHTDQVLGEMGFSKDEIADMRAKGIV